MTKQCLQKQGNMGFTRDGDYGAYEPVNESIFLPVAPTLPFDALLAAFKAGNPSPIHAEAGRRALALAYAAIESFESGRRVKIER